MGAAEGFLGETRARVLTLLRAEPRTVNDLAAALTLTDNAVRAQLAELQEEGLVVSAGQRAGLRKPHALYALTPRAHEVLSRLYLPVLSSLLDVLGERLSPAEKMALLEDVGHKLAAGRGNGAGELPLAERLPEVMALLASLGADATAVQEAGQWVIRGSGCPLGAVVARHPGACAVLETFLRDYLGQPVREACTKGDSPRCCFRIGA